MLWTVMEAWKGEPDQLIFQGPGTSCMLPKIRLMHSQKWNCAALFPISTFIHSCICERTYSQDRSAYLASAKQADRSWEYLNRSQIHETGRRSIIILFGNNEAVQFRFWEYINWNQTFILDSCRPFICSEAARCYQQNFQLIQPSPIKSQMACRASTLEGLCPRLPHSGGRTGPAFLCTL